MKRTIQFISVTLISIAVVSCSPTQDLSSIDDDVYFNSEDIAKLDQKQKEQQEGQVAGAGQKPSQPEPEEDYYDKDYNPYTGGFSPYNSPIYDPFIGPPHMRSQMYGGWNSSFGYGYNSMYGSYMSMGFGYGSGGYYPYSYPSFYNPYYPNYYNPYYGNPGWGYTGGGGSGWVPAQTDNSRRVYHMPRSKTSNYRDDALNRQFIQNSARSRSSYRNQPTNQSNYRRSPQQNNTQNNSSWGSPTRQRATEQESKGRIYRSAPSNNHYYQQNRSSSPTRNSGSYSSPTRSRSGGSNSGSSPTRRRQY